MFEVTEIRGSVEQGKVGPLASGVEDRFYAQGLERIDIVSVNHELEARVTPLPVLPDTTWLRRKSILQVSMLQGAAAADHLEFG